MIILSDPRIEKFDKTVKMKSEATDALMAYWHDFSLYFSLEYWIMISILLVPLIVLFFRIDKSKIFLIGFYGYSVHIAFAYIDIFGQNNGRWNYPFPILPVLPGLAIDSSLVPITYMLIYQWTLNNNKNYYIYSMIAALIFSFIFKPLLVALGLFKLYGNTNYFHLFIGYVLVLIIAKFITDLFLWTQKKFRSS
jgi:hypothetical protein